MKSFKCNSFFSFHFFIIGVFVIEHELLLSFVTYKRETTLPSSTPPGEEEVPDKSLAWELL